MLWCLLRDLSAGDREPGDLTMATGNKTYWFLRPALPADLQYTPLKREEGGKPVGFVFQESWVQTWLDGGGWWFFA